MTISRVKFPWPPFFRIFIFFDEIFISVCGTTYLMRDDGATVVKVRSSRVICSLRNPTDVLAQPCIDFAPAPGFSAQLVVCTLDGRCTQSFVTL